MIKFLYGFYMISYRNQSINLLPKSMDWFLYDNGLPHERIKVFKSDIDTLTILSSDTEVL